MPTNTQASNSAELTALHKPARTGRTVSCQLDKMPWPCPYVRQRAARNAAMASDSDVPIGDLWFLGFKRESDS